MKDSEFLFISAGVATYPPGATLGPRNFPHYEIIWIIEGDVRWICNGVSHDMPPGSFFIVPLGVKDFFYWDQADITRHAYLEFDLLPGCTNPAINMKWPVSIIAEHDNLLAPLMRHMMYLCQVKADNWEQLSTYALNHFLILYASGNAGITPNNELADFPPELQRIIKYVYDAWAGSEPMRIFTIDEMKARGNVSRTQLFRLFNKYFKTSPVEALRTGRLERGVSLLIGTELTVQQVAFQTGFDTQFHFSKSFKQFFGICPRDFRKQHRAKQCFSFTSSLLSRLLWGSRSILST